MRYWKRIDTQGIITTVEGYSHSLDIEGAIEITKEEYDKFIASLPVVEPESPLVFEPPETGIPEKVEYIEQYLKELQRR